MARKLGTLLIFALLIPAAAAASPITALYVFGDSLSDQGNAFAITGGTFPPGPYVQRASNGPTAVERLAADLGVPLSAAAAGGTNFAVIGAATGPVVIPGTASTTENVATISYAQPLLEGTSLLSQVAGFLIAQPGPVVNPDGSLFVVWGGPNDFFINPSATTAANAVSNLSTAIGALYLDGARHFLVPNMPDLSLTPYGQSLTPPQTAGLQALSAGFNAGLAGALTGLAALPGIDITPFDSFSLLTGISLNPGAFGFTNAVAPCLSGDPFTSIVVCGTPDSYLFWDALHPTTAAHRVLGDAFAAELADPIPEPSTLWLVGIGIALAGAAQLRSRL